MAKAAYIFPGQGSQYLGMGKDLYENYHSARAIFDCANQALGRALSTLCFEGPAEALTLTVNAQPALLAMSMACLAAVREARPQGLPEPLYLAGHSLGEYSALTAAGAFDFETAVRLARERGRLMHEAGIETPGSMAAIIGISTQLVETICRKTGAYIANLNCPGQVVISGPADAVQAASTLAKERGAKLAIKLQVSGAFHSPLMQSAADGLKEQLRLTENISVPAIPVIGNTGVRRLDTPEQVRDELLGQVCSCVRWEETVGYLLAQGVDTFVEIGPGEVLTGLVKRIDPNAKTINIGSVEDILHLNGN